MNEGESCAKAIVLQENQGTGSCDASQYRPYRYIKNFQSTFNNSFKKSEKGNASTLLNCIFTN